MRRHVTTQLRYQLLHDWEPAAWGWDSSSVGHEQAGAVACRGGKREGLSRERAEALLVPRPTVSTRQRVLGQLGGTIGRNNERRFEPGDGWMGNWRAGLPGTETPRTRGLRRIDGWLLYLGSAGGAPSPRPPRPPRRLRLLPGRLSSAPDACCWGAAAAGACCCCWEAGLG